MATASRTAAAYARWSKVEHVQPADVARAIAVANPPSRSSHLSASHQQCYEDLRRACLATSGWLMTSITVLLSACKVRFATPRRELCCIA